MGQDMSITVRRDEFSLQLTHSDSKFFFVRIESLETQAQCVTFTDFILPEGKAQLGHQALEYLWQEFPRIYSVATWKFLDIYPRGEDVDGTLQKENVVRRFDELVDLLTPFFQARGLKLRNPILNQTHGKFEAVFELQNPPKTGPFS